MCLRFKASCTVIISPVFSNMILPVFFLSLHNKTLFLGLYFMCNKVAVQDERVLVPRGLQGPLEEENISIWDCEAFKNLLFFWCHLLKKFAFYFIPFVVFVVVDLLPVRCTSSYCMRLKMSTTMISCFIILCLVRRETRVYYFKYIYNTSRVHIMSRDAL